MEKVLKNCEMFSENVNCDLNTTASECKETKVALIKHCTHKECGGTFHLKLSKRKKKKKTTLFASIKFRDLGKIAKRNTRETCMDLDFSRNLILAANYIKVKDYKNIKIMLEL